MYHHHEQNVNKNMNIKRASKVRFQMKMKNKLLAPGEKTRHIVAENLIVLSSTVVWKIQLIRNELGHLAERFSSKVLRVQTVFVLLLIVKGETKEKYWLRNY